jgi:precorrin-6A/cobalt-precorrin-6A reductase
LLAQALMAVGWQVRVSVVSAEAARAYWPHPHLEVVTGAIGVDQPAVGQQLSTSRSAGHPFTWVIDASHPFACRISEALSHGCQRWGQPLLRLQRPLQDPQGAEILKDLADLDGRCRPGERLLLAIGARHLALARNCSPGALHHARVLPRPGALRQALAAGVAPERLVCLQPLSDPAAPTPIEAACCRRWRIETVLCRCSGGPGEHQWRRLAVDLHLRLLMLERPRESGNNVAALTYPELLQRLGATPRSQSGTP